MTTTENKSPTTMIGPLLFLDQVEKEKVHLSALFITSDHVAPEEVIVDGAKTASVKLASVDGIVAWRARFHLPTSGNASYQWAGQTYNVTTDLSGDARIGYVSCNGEEIADLEREGSERNVMWGRLLQQHAEKPLSLLLHGGDQVYADEVSHCHPLSEEWPEKIPRDITPADVEDLKTSLRQGYFERYRAVYSAPETARLMAEVPSLMQWDDHDICDGWGSLRRSRTYSPVGQAIFSVAREAALIFQHACVDDDLPARFGDARGLSLSWAVDLPDFRIMAPDLRSERTRRQVMGEVGWDIVRQWGEQKSKHSFLMSSVPLLGPRLSIFETLMVLTPSMQKYEDDLRDQWQSRSHRDEWRRMLKAVSDMSGGEAITALSGEIHLATRAEMALGDGRVLHQLVASGITHRPPPQNWARLLGAVAALGEDPLPKQPIRITRIPGQKGRYVAERNFLVLERREGLWKANWHFEHGGETSDLML